MLAAAKSFAAAKSRKGFGFVLLSGAGRRGVRRCRGKHPVDQAAYVTVKHLFSRPFGTSLRGWSVPRIFILGYFQPFLSKLDF
jgi:hypothetical protein